MALRSSQSDQVFRSVRRLCYAGLAADELHRAAVAELRRAIPFEGYCAFDLDPASGLTVGHRSDPPDADLVRIFLERVAGESPDPPDAARRASAVTLLSEATGGRPDRSAVHREILAPRGFHFQLRCAYASGARPWGGIAAYRERGRPDFAQPELALFERLAPHLGHGLRAAALSAAAVASPLADDDPLCQPGVLVLDARGRVEQLTPAVERWLRALADLGPGWREGQGLPDAVWAAVAALRRALDERDERDGARVPRVRARARTGGWLELHAARGRSPDGQAASTIVVIEPVVPPEGRDQPARSRAARPADAMATLSSREREVVELVARGASTREIAARLCVTEYTVQDHLKHVFNKVGVRGRLALVKRLYLDGQIH